MIIYYFKKRLEKEINKLINDVIRREDFLSKDISFSSEKLKNIFKNISIQEPKNQNFGDLSTNAAMVLAPHFKKNPVEVARMLTDYILSGWDECENVNVEKPGFINFNFKDSFIKEKLKDIAAKKINYGFNSSGKGIKIQLEYVSSNPTGNLHIGHGRWGALGDSLANIYAANGYQVFREYYVNDYGSQVKKFAECVRCLYLKNFNIKIPYPKDGYPREVVLMVVENITEKFGDEFLKHGSKKDRKYAVDIKSLERESVKIMLSSIKDTLSIMGVNFDMWFYESFLYKNSNFNKVIGKLKTKNIIYEKEGALWFKASSFGDDKDRVIVRSDGNPTYFASDILYLNNKIERGFGIFLYILGADHHGYVKRLKAVGRALGIEDDRLIIIVGQLVKLVRGGKVIKMSRRKGKLYGLKELLLEVGKDSVRYFFCTNSFDTPVDFDIELARKKSTKNPVYYVQYVSARIESILKKIKNSSIKNVDVEKFNTSSINFSELKFKTGSERKLAKIMILYPDIIFTSCKNNQPYYVVRYIWRLAEEFHYFYNHYRIIGKNRINLDRFVLVLLVKIVLKNALKILNISAPEKM